MKNCKRLALLLILLLIIAIMSTLFVACDFAEGEPYYGTYYGGKQNGEIATSITIDKNYVSLDGERWNYTYQNGVVTLSSGAEIIIAENYQITYMKKYLLWKYGTAYSWDSSIRQRNGYFSDTLYMFNDNYSTIEVRYEFYSDGTYEFLHLMRNGYERGNYYLNSGVLTLCCKESLRSDIPVNSERYWYIDESYSIYSGVMIKDASKFAGASYVPSPPDSGNNGNNGNNSNNGNNGNGSSQEKTYIVTWKNYDGTILKTDYNVPEGSTPTYDGLSPTRDESNGYVYSFTGWSPYITEIYGDTTYTAQFTSSLKENSYTVTWKNYDGTILETDYNVPRGSTPTYDGNTPTREAEEGYNYIFKGWSPSVSSVYEDKTFTAQYDATLAIPNLPTNTHPILESANTSFEGDGTEESPYLIKTSAQLLGMGAYADKHFALANNIILPLNSQDRPNFTPLFSDEKPFNGTFDGRGYTIKNLYIYNTDTYYTGLFASVGENGVVKNLELADVKIFGANYVGGIAGLSFGSIIDCEVSGNITYVPANDYQVYIGGIAGRGSLDKCNSAVEIKVFGFNSTCYVGGLAGYSTSKSIPDSSNTGNIIVKTTIRNSNNSTYVGGLVGYGYSSNTITSSYNTGAITVDSGGVYTYVGGLVGSGYSITSSYNTGSITVDSVAYTYVGGLLGNGSSGTTITSSYNTGAITVDRGNSSTYVGGLVGSGSSITRSYNTGDITVDSGSSTYVGGLVGDGSSIKSSYNTGAITVNGRGSSTYVGGLAGYGGVTIKNSHWLYYEDGAPVNAVGYNSGMGVPTNIGATKHTDISEFYNLADTLNEGLKEPAFEHKTSSSLPTLIKKEN